MEAITHRIRIAGAEPSVFDCASDETLLHAALRAGLGFPHDCHSGGCGGCTYTLQEGRVSERWVDAPGLPAQARERGLRLACQTSPEGDCAIKLRLKPAYVAAITPYHQRLAFVDARDLTHDMRLFRFRSAAPADFIAGQYALLHLPGVVGARAYSMSNVPNADGLWEFIIKRTPTGAGTSMLFERLRPGDAIALDGPYGNAYLRADTQHDVVCIGGGSGLSPMLAILRAAAADPRLVGRRLRLFYGARLPRDHCLADLLAEEPALQDRVEVVLAISNVDEASAASWTGERGFTHEVVDRHLAGSDAAGSDYYFCGPPPMTDAVHQLLLLQRNVPSAQLRFDRFY